MSGRQVQAKKIRFFERTPSKGSKRHVALQRAQKRHYLQYLEKIGKLEEELQKMRSHRRRRR